MKKILYSLLFSLFAFTAISQTSGGYTPSYTPTQDRVLYTGNNTVPTIAPTLGIETNVLANGDRYDWNGSAWIKEPIVASNYNNDLGLSGGKIQTGFPLVRNTFTGGAFYREWSNNQTGVTGTGQGLVYGLNNYGLGTGYWDKALIGQGAFTAGYYNTVTGAYSGAIGQQNVVTANNSFATGLINRVSNLYSQALGYNNTQAGYASLALGAINTQVGGSYNLLQGYNNFANNNYGFVGGLNNGTLSVPITGTGTIVYGNSHVNNSNYSAQFGLVGRMAGSYHIGAGYGTQIAGSYNAAFCYDNILTASSFGNMVGGYSNRVAGERGVIGGVGNTYNGAYSAMFGNSNTIAAGVYGTQTSGTSNQANGGWNSFLAGEGNIADAGGLYTKIALGYYNTIRQNSHVVFALGQSNVIGSATGSLANAGAGAIGGSNTVVGTASVAIGYANNMSGTGSYNYTLGDNNSITGTAYQNVLIGQGATTSRSGTITIKAAGSRINITSVPNYTNVAAANADASLITGDLYTVTQGGGKQLFIK